VYGAVVCSYDAVSLFYLELYVKLSIYLSIYLSICIYYHMSDFGNQRKLQPFREMWFSVGRHLNVGMWWSACEVCLV
jgi:hypothetical protein